MSEDVSSGIKGGDLNTFQSTSAAQYRESNYLVITFFAHPVSDSSRKRVLKKLFLLRKGPGWFGSKGNDKCLLDRMCTSDHNVHSRVRKITSLSDNDWYSHGTWDIIFLIFWSIMVCHWFDAFARLELIFEYKENLIKVC